MTYAVHKQDGKAWLKENTLMKEPNHLDYKIKNQYNEWVFKSDSAMMQYGDDYETYSKHIASLRTIQIAPEYVDYWSKGAKVKEGEFETTTARLKGNRNETTIVAIPGQDEADVYSFTREQLADEQLKYSYSYKSTNVYRSKIKTQAMKFTDEELKEAHVGRVVAQSWQDVMQSCWSAAINFFKDTMRGNIEYLPKNEDNEIFIGDKYSIRAIMCNNSFVEAQLWEGEKQLAEILYEQDLTIIPVCFFLIIKSKSNDT